MFLDRFLCANLNYLTNLVYLSIGGAAALLSVIPFTNMAVYVQVMYAAFYPAIMGLCDVFYTADDRLCPPGVFGDANGESWLSTGSFFQDSGYTLEHWILGFVMVGNTFS